jgi:hypothetical protein
MFAQLATVMVMQLVTPFVVDLAIPTGQAAQTEADV